MKPAVVGDAPGSCEVKTPLCADATGLLTRNALSWGFVFFFFRTDGAPPPQDPTVHVALRLSRGVGGGGHLMRNMHAPLYMGTSLIRNITPPHDRHRAPGIVLLQGPRVGLFLMSEVPLHRPPLWLGMSRLARSTLWGYNPV